MLKCRCSNSLFQEPFQSISSDGSKSLHIEFITTESEKHSIYHFIRYCLVTGPKTLISMIVLCLFLYYQPLVASMKYSQTNCINKFKVFHNFVLLYSVVIFPNRAPYSKKWNFFFCFSNSTTKKVSVPVTIYSPLTQESNLTSFCSTKETSKMCL